MSRYKKYKTASALQKGVDGYFDSISRQVPVNEDGRADGLPHKVRTDSGSFMIRREYLVPPTISALCLYLKISRQTWTEYGECFPDEVADAKLRIQCYLEEQLLTRRKGVQGIIFNLQNNYGYSEKKEIELGEATRNDMLSGMTASEKMELIKSVGMELIKSVGNEE